MSHTTYWSLSPEEVIKKLQNTDLKFIPGKTSEDWDRLEAENKEMREIMQNIVNEYQPMKILNTKEKEQAVEKAAQFLERKQKPQNP